MAKKKKKRYSKRSIKKNSRKKKTFASKDPFKETKRDLKKLKKAIINFFTANAKKPQLKKYKILKSKKKVKRKLKKNN